MVKATANRIFLEHKPEAENDSKVVTLKEIEMSYSLEELQI